MSTSLRNGLIAVVVGLLGLGGAVGACAAEMPSSVATAFGVAGTGLLMFGGRRLLEEI